MSAASYLFDPLADDEPPAAAAMPAPGAKPVAGARRQFLSFYKPSVLAAYETPPDVPLIGDMHLFKGSVFVLGGAPGVGKSFALSQLAISGATGEDWFGLPVHRRFKTMILQAENGLVRLASEYREHVKRADLDEWVRVSGDADVFAFDDADFQAEFKAAVAEFAPDVIVLDPWNRATRDSMEKDYRAAFDAILACLPEGDARPALLIVAHTRKPRMGERVSGRGLLNLLSGSLVLGSIPRAGCILQAASDDPEGDEFVFTCCKNNNGPLGKQTAWKREGPRFMGPLVEFDWKAFNGEGGSAGNNEKVTEKDMLAVFENGRVSMSPAAAVKKLRALTKCGKSAAYNALDKVKGRFADCIEVTDPEKGLITYRSPWPDDEEGDE
jgi:hypothetical protein